MAKQTKKIQRHLTALNKDREQASEAKKGPPPGKDYLLLAMIAITLVILTLAWQQFSMSNRAMYILMALALTCTYVRRHADLSDNMKLWVERTGYVSIGSAFGLFCLTLYYQIFG